MCRELPIAVRGMYSASQIQSTQSSTSCAGDLLGGATDLSLEEQETCPKAHFSSTGPFDAMIAIGVLIKGETMHFEYIAESVSSGLMRVQLDSGVPLIFGLLTVLNEEQARTRAGLGKDGTIGEDGYQHHNHGEDWGVAAVELGVRKRQWAEGKIE